MGEVGRGAGEGESGWDERTGSHRDVAARIKLWNDALTIGTKEAPQENGVQLSRLMTYELFGIDQNFIFNYKKKVEELSSAGILEAAKRHLHPGNQPVLVVADASKVMPALKTLGREIVVLHPDYLP
ncbi:hypothetical protein L7F22_037431 [Adiantum nelumboides]|nr:hypothetical protein [Adiantum nelumboides]